LLYGRLISQRRFSESRWNLFNILGTTVQILDNVQNATDTYVHDAWGVSILSSGMTVNPYRYIGEYGYYSDFDTALCYVRVRIYRPSIARWLSEDPIMFIEGSNLYKYCANRVSVSNDPSGKLSIGQANQCLANTPPELQQLLQNTVRDCPVPVRPAFGSPSGNRGETRSLGNGLVFFVDPAQAKSCDELYQVMRHEIQHVINLCLEIGKDPLA